MVDVEIAVVSDLPIWTFNHLAIEVMPPLESETLKHLIIPTQEIVDGKTGVRVKVYPDEACALKAR